MTRKSLANTVLGCLLVLGGLGLCRPALAQAVPAAGPNASAGPTAPAGPSAPAAPAAPSAVLLDKAGPLMLNLRLGPAINLKNTPSTMFALGLDVGYAITGDRNAYLLFQPQIELASEATFVMIPLGFQYDIALPVRGLYVYPRASIGYAALITSAPFGLFPVAGTYHNGVATPELGLKYVLRGRFNLGFEPFSLPIVFSSNTVAVQYRVMFYLGVNL